MIRNYDVWDNDRVGYYVHNYGEPECPKPDQLKRMLLAKNLIEGDSVLDCGCGHGALYHQLSYNIEYAGMDASLPMVEYARLHAPEAEFYIGDIYDLSEFGVYDTTMAQSILIHLPDIVKAIQEMWAHTRRCMVFSIPIALQSAVNVHEYYKDRVLLSHAEPEAIIKEILEKLPNYGGYETVVEPNSQINNTYFKIWRDII